MPGISDEQVAQAYPTFYGQIALCKDFDSKEPDGRNYTKYGIKPYGAADGSDLTPPGQTGLYWGTIFWKPEDVLNPSRDIHQFILGLKAMKVPNGGDTNQATGFEGWFKLRPPRNGYPQPLMPCAQPRINGKAVPVPPRPDDWDLDTWVSENSRDDEADDAPAPGGIDIDNPVNWDIIYSNVVGKTRTAGTKALLSSELSNYGVGDIGRALDKLVESGALRVDDGKYLEGAS